MAARFVTGRARPFLAQALKPQKVNGRWRKPKISARVAAKIRKTAILNGTFGEGGDWDPAWDKKQHATINRMPKGKKHDNNKFERVAKIQRELEDMPKRIEAMRKANRAAKPDKGVEKYFKKEKWEV